MPGKGVEDAGDRGRDSSSHDYECDTGQHGAVDGRKVGQLDLLEVVDTDRPVVSFAGEMNLHEVTQNAQLVEHSRPRLLVERHGCVGFAVGLAARDVVPLQGASGHVSKWKLLQSPADMPANVAVLETSDEEHLECNAGHDPELSQHRNRSRQVPVRDCDAHPTLDDLRECGSHGPSSLPTVVFCRKSACGNDPPSQKLGEHLVAG